jgi:1-acyl-sn-glycerol-3-phosphate acyltransferase
VKYFLSRILNKITEMKYKSTILRLKHEPLITIVYFIIRNLLAPLIRLIWIRRTYGLENIPKWGPVIIAFNHQSYFDFFCFIAISPRNIHFLAAEKFFTNKLWKIPMLLSGQIEVNRTNKNKYETHSKVYEHLDAGKMIGIFPEGTRSPDKTLMLKAFTGVAKYAIFKKVPVIPVGIKGTFDIMSKQDKKPNFTKIVEFHIGKPIDAHRYLIGKLNEDEYQKVTDKIMFDIANLSGKRYKF